MATISLCMIVKNEEDVLARCLNSVKDVVDEIIIVDTGSTDKTKEIAFTYTDKVYDFKWCDDFSKARNFSFSKATKRYQMWLDADDVLLEEDKINFLKLKQNLSNEIDIVMLKYSIAFDSNGKPTYSYYRERLLKRDNNYKWVSPIHEVITPTGNVIYEDISITHKKEHANNPKRNIEIFKKIISNNIKLDTRQQFYYARELYYNGEYLEAINEFNLFLESNLGWCENCISACIDLSNSYYAINNNTLALHSLYKSFDYDKPRAEICCLIGKHFLTLNKYQQSIYWYELATTLPVDITTGGFYNLDSHRYIPYIQLCVCYDKIKDYKKANEYNEKAGIEKPNDPSFLYNKDYFNKVLD